MSIKLTTTEFIIKAKAIHGSKYSYKRSVCVGAVKPITITCKNHGDFQQTARYHLKGLGCRQCYVSSLSNSHSSFVSRARERHGTTYSYEKSKYIDSRVLVEIICSTHGSFFQLPCTHIRGAGCRKCADLRTSQKALGSTNEFIQKSRIVHSNKYSYTRCIFTGSTHKVIITCPDHGDFTQLAMSHLAGSGCSRCNIPRRYSKMACKWIEEYAYSHRLKNVQHAQSTGEYKIPGTRLYVDGFHARSNTVFEFHGDDFHGNPNKHKPHSKPNPFSPKTARQLYQDTLARENRIRSLGYTLVVMWELEYKSQT